MRKALLVVLVLVSAAVQFAAAGPAPCESPCEFGTYGFGYVPALQNIRSGTTVIWSTQDTSHPTSDSTDAYARCFLVEVGRNVAPAPVRFDVAGGAVRATTRPGTPEKFTQTCTSATALPAGSFLLPFRCVLHPYMRGVLLIDQ